MEKTSICVIGSGNLGTTIGKILANNAVAMPEVEDRVNIFVYDELFEGMRISEVINSHHVNEKYLPMVQLPENLVACTDLVETAKYADVIVFVMPQQFVGDFCKTLLGKIKPSAMAISLIKGFTVVEGGGIELISQTIMKYLKIPCAVLMGVNLASEVSMERYCEATLGYRDMKHSKMLKDLFSGPNFRVTVIDDAECVEVCGYLKQNIKFCTTVSLPTLGDIITNHSGECVRDTLMNKSPRFSQQHMIAFASGLLDGLEANENTKSACLRFCLIEMIRFIDVFYPGCKLSTLFESCGIADVITVCCGSRNRRLAEAFVKTEQSIDELENELMGGEKLLGPVTAKEVNFMLQQKGLQDKFPVFTTIHKICQYTVKPQELLKCITSTPNIIYHPTQVFPL